jgi:hypothetical protein
MEPFVERKSIRKGVLALCVLVGAVGLAVYGGLTIYHEHYPGGLVSQARVAGVASSKETLEQSINTGMPSFELSSAKCHVINGLPDPMCTSGVIDPRVTQDNLKETICKPGYTKTVRPPESVTAKIKIAAMQDYGFTDSPSHYELDHLISLELGGAPDDPANLFPEPYDIDLNAKKKDTVENYLHAQVCNGSIALEEAQHEISTNWVLVYQGR